MPWQLHVLKTRATDPAKLFLMSQLAHLVLIPLSVSRVGTFCKESLEEQYIYWKQNLDFEIYFENELW